MSATTEIFEKLTVQAFDTAQPGDPVYQPEYSEGEPPMTKQEFIDLAEGDQVVARNLFAACEWQHPETLLDEHGGIGFFHPEFNEIESARKNGTLVTILYGKTDYGMFLAIYGADELPIYKDNNQDATKIAVIVGVGVAGKILRDEGARMGGDYPPNYRKLLIPNLRVNTELPDESAAQEARVDEDMRKATVRQDADFRRHTNAISTYVPILREFIGTQQLKTMLALVRGEEGQFFVDKLDELRKLVETMPKTYEQDGMGDEAIAYMHYFTAGANFYITERDMEVRQIQAYGLSDLYGDGGEMGYISIEELKKVGAELDLHWTPKTLREIKDPNSLPPVDDDDIRKLCVSHDCMGIWEAYSALKLNPSMDAWEDLRSLAIPWNERRQTVWQACEEVATQGDGQNFGLSGRFGKTFPSITDILVTALRVTVSDEDVPANSNAPRG